MNSPVAIENAPATRPASPVRITVCDDTPPPPTPLISDTLVTRPSIAPKTVGRSQPPLTSRCWCSSARAGVLVVMGTTLPHRRGPHTSARLKTGRSGQDGVMAVQDWLLTSPE